MLRSIAGFLAQWSDRAVCFDIAENKKKELEKLRSLVNQPENFKHRLAELQVESSIMDRFATEKNNRLIVLLTFVLTFLTLILTVLTSVLLFKK